LLPKLLRFSDLKRLNIVRNYTTLDRWLKAGNFPPPIRLGPNSIAWTEQSIVEWLASKRKSA
jgi:predicted DNA-binding transcriptional regulator AlpA